jgi:zinc transporter 1/2/3
MDTMDAVRTVEVECDSGNDYDGRMGLRISAIFIIGLGSMLGTLILFNPHMASSLN